MASRKEVIAVLGKLVAAYPRFQLGKETAELYIEMLSDLDAERLEVGARRYIQTGQYFPTVAELRSKTGVVAI